jgi:hypothetical protein
MIPTPFALLLLNLVWLELRERKLPLQLDFYDTGIIIRQIF